LFVVNTALVTGVTGQDGSYIAELLLEKGYRVIGAVRDTALARNRLHPRLRDRVELVDWNMRDEKSMRETILAQRPVEIYNFAAYSSGEGQFDDPAAIADINGVAVARLLEAIRLVDTSIRLCQASSREIFGNPHAAPQSETTPCIPRTPYGAAKLYADAMIRIYRERYGLFGCSAILFNHESPRRALHFVTRKVTHAAAMIKLGRADRLHLGNLASRRDWGFSGDYVRGMWMMLQQPRADDYVLATGTTHSVEELCEIAFARVGLDFRRYVHVENASFRGDEAVELVGDASKARRALGWTPSISFPEMVQMMVDADVATLES
jgi:GDPmannose 4,6-dehydratase